MTVTIIGQTSVNITQAPAVAGDFASVNPMHNALSPIEGAFRAGPSGCTIALWAWNDSSGNYLNNYGAGTPNAFIARTQEALITTYLSAYGNTIPAGFMVGSAFDKGDFWVNNAGTTLAQPGMKAYASLTAGTTTFNWTGNTSTCETASNASIAGNTVSAATFTGSITDGVLTAGTVTNTIYPGAILTGGGSGFLAGTYVTGQLTGVAGAAGTYTVYPAEQTCASASLTATASVLSGGTMQSGTIAVGDVIVTSGTTAATTGTIVGMTVMANVTANEWSLAPAQGLTAAGTLTSGTVYLATNVETKWYAKSNGAQNEPVIISDTL